MGSEAHVPRGVGIVGLGLMGGCLARGLKASLAPDKAYHGLVARVNHAPGASGPIWLLQPMTYMNLSGKSVGSLANFFKIAPEECLVVHDELDFPPGTAKLKQGGGVAGHNGLKDIAARLGSHDFWRLRVGIGHPGDRNLVGDYVLSSPSPAWWRPSRSSTSQMSDAGSSSKIFTIDRKSVV